MTLHGVTGKQGKLGNLAPTTNLQPQPQPARGCARGGFAMMRPWQLRQLTHPRTETRSKTQGSEDGEAGQMVLSCRTSRPSGSCTGSGAPIDLRRDRNTQSPGSFVCHLMVSSLLPNSVPAAQTLRSTRITQVAPDGGFNSEDLGGVFLWGGSLQAHLQERAILPPRKGSFRRADARLEGVGLRARVLAPKPQASKQASKQEEERGRKREGGREGGREGERERERERNKMVEGVRERAGCGATRSLYPKAKQRERERERERARASESERRDSQRETERYGFKASLGFRGLEWPGLANFSFCDGHAARACGIRR